MTDHPHDMTAEQLARQGEFLRGLARSLVTDDHEADDLVQETWLRALKDGPEAPPRSWFRTVLRNLTREGFRKGRRRERREQVAALNESLPSHDEMLERLEVNHRLALAVMDLAEPYRSTIHLHFFEQRSLREIADRTGVPWETVRSRLKRGLQQLRLRLDRDAGGDRSRWMAALVPLSEGSWQGVAIAGAGATATGAGAWTMGTTAAAVVIGVGAWMWFGGEDGVVPPMPVDPPAVTGAATPVPEPIPAAPQDVDDEGGVEITGRFRVVDRDGSVHDGESGQFELIWREGESMRLETVVVTDGQFRHRITPTTMLGAWRVTLGGKYAKLKNRQLEYTEGEPLDLTVYWQPPVIFQVHDARTGEPLDRVDVRQRQYWSAMGMDEHPGEHEAIRVVVDNAASPVTVPGDDDTKVYWTRAPGYAWERVNVDHEVGGTFAPGLVPEALLNVTLEGEFVRHNAFVRLRRPDHEKHQWALQVPAPTGATLNLDGLKAGTYELSLDRGEFLESDSLATVTVELTEGETTSVRLTVDPARQNRALAAVSGSLQLPPEARSMNQMPHSIRIRVVEAEDGRPVESVRITLDRMQEVAGERGLYRFDVGPIPPGVYVVEVDRCMYRQKFRVHDEGLEDLRVDVPPLRKVRVRVYDEAGKLTTADKVGWSVADLPGVRFGASRDAIHDPATGEYWLVAPMGEIEVGVHDVRFRVPGQTLHVSAEGPNEIEFHLRAIPHLQVRLMDDGVPVTPSDETWWWNCQLTSNRGDGRIKRSQFSSAFFQVPAPGEYVLLLPPLPGYAAIERQVIQVEAGENKIDVEVRRED